MPDAYVLATDGGRTGTTCLVAHIDGTIVRRAVGGHLLHLAQPDGEAAMASAFHDCIWAGVGNAITNPTAITRTYVAGGHRSATPVPAQGMGV